MKTYISQIFGKNWDLYVTIWDIYVTIWDLYVYEKHIYPRLKHRVLRTNKRYPLEKYIHLIISPVR